MTIVRNLPCPEQNAIDDAGAWTPLYDGVIEALRRNEVGATAPVIGDSFPDISLPDAFGQYRTLADLVSRRRTVVSFQRGLWCPYCSHELDAWHETLPLMTNAGVQLVIIAGEVGGRAEALRRRAGDDAIVLCDVDHGAALACGLAFHIGADVKRRYLEFGLDLADVYGSDSWFMPVPATFIVEPDGVVSYAYVEPDFRLRADPQAVAAIAAA